MVRRLAILLLLLVGVVGCSGEEGSAEDSHLTAPVMKPKGQKSEEQARGMTEETTRGMGEKKLGHDR